MTFRDVFYFFRRTQQGQQFKPVILITGCASGIGLALAKLLVKKEQYRLVLTAREKSIGSLKNQFREDQRVWIRPLDVTSEDQRLALIHEIETKWGGVNVLVNNAGISYRSVVEHMSDQEELAQLNVNYLGPMALIKRVLPLMRLKGRGKIINVSSVSGMLAMPTMASYSASKYALEGASESLWYETRPFGIDICLVQPGFVRSSSFENVYYSHLSKLAMQKDIPYSDFYEAMGPFVGKMMKKSFSTAEDVARKILWAIQKEAPPLWIPATYDAYIFYYLRRLMPRRLLLPFLFLCLPGARHWGKRHTHKRARQG